MKLKQLLTEAEYNEYFIKGSQLIVVKSHESRATVYLFEKEKDVWLHKATISEAYIGKSGITREKQEGDNKTPYGLYQLGFAFGLEDKPQNSKYPYKKLTDNIYWIDDIDSEYYNNWVEISEKSISDNCSYCRSVKKISWKSSEHLIEYKKQYQYAVVIEYNTLNPFDTTENQGNKLGSAIFLHVINSGSTAGCIAVSKKNMEEILIWLKKEKSPQILIY